MRPITRRALQVINSERFDSITLLDIRVAGASAASTVRLTNAGEEITWNGNTYYPMMLSRSRLDDRLLVDGGGVPSLEISVSNVSTALATIIQENELEDADVTVRALDRRLTGNARDAWIVSVGKLKSPTITRSLFSFKVIPLPGDLERTMIPRRLWQPHCSYPFGSYACGVDLLSSPNSITDTMQTGTCANFVVVTSAVLTAASNPADPNDYWMNGQIVVVSGNAATQSVPFQRYELVGSQRRFYCRRPFLVAPEAGETVLIQRGCPKTKGACFDRQGNYLNYGGFEEVPYGNVQPTIIGDVPSV